MTSRAGRVEVGVFALLAVIGVGTLLLLVTCWDLRWVSDDWEVLQHAREGAWQLESIHVSIPRRVLFAGVVLADAGPWLIRVAMWLCLVVASLLLLPRVVRLLFPDWPRLRSYSVGLATLALSTTLEAAIWPSTIAYSVLACCLLLLAGCHLRWLAAPTGPRRAASVLATCACLGTWELGVGAVPLVGALSIAQGRTVRRSAADSLPHAVVLAGYLALKLLIGSSHFPIGGPVRILGNTGYLPLFQLSPVPVTHGFVTSPIGVACAAAALGLVAICAFSLGRRGWMLLAIPYALLLPVLLGPGSAQRYLVLTAPWFVLLLWAAALTPRGSPRWRLAGTLVLVIAAPLHLVTSERTVRDWHRAADAAARLEEEIALASRGAGQIAVLNMPDRLPGWGPTYQIWVWRNGLPDRLRQLGIDRVAHGFTQPVDAEILGFALNAPLVDDADLEDWRRRGLRVLDARPSWTALHGEGTPARWVELR